MAHVMKYGTRQQLAALLVEHDSGEFPAKLECCFGSGLSVLVRVGDTVVWCASSREPACIRFFKTADAAINECREICALAGRDLDVRVFS